MFTLFTTFYFLKIFDSFWPHLYFLLKTRDYLWMRNSWKGFTFRTLILGEQRNVKQVQRSLSLYKCISVNSLIKGNLCLKINVFWISRQFMQFFKGVSFSIKFHDRWIPPFRTLPTNILTSLKRKMHANEQNFFQ